MPNTAFRVHAVAQAELDGADLPAVHRRAEGDEPLRCCLRGARPGEAIRLVNYTPPLPAAGPYLERGAVFAHAEPCPGPADDGYPAAWADRPQVLRAYDERGWIHAAVVHDGTDPLSRIAELLADPAVVLIHSRNIAYGCYMFAVTRA